jgi:hypothetical protein
MSPLTIRPSLYACIMIDVAKTDIQDRHRSSLGNTLFGTNEVFGPIRDLKSDLMAQHGKM